MTDLTPQALDRLVEELRADSDEPAALQLLVRRLSQRDARLPTSISDLSDGDLTFFWGGQGREASLSFMEDGTLGFYCHNASSVTRTYEGEFSFDMIREFFAALSPAVEGGGGERNSLSREPSTDTCAAPLASGLADPTSSGAE